MESEVRKMDKIVRELKKLNETFHRAVELLEEILEMLKAL